MSKFCVVKEYFNRFKRNERPSSIMHLQYCTNASTNIGDTQRSLQLK